jgi:hypothetical protein
MRNRKILIASLLVLGTTSCEKAPAPSGGAAPAAADASAKAGGAAPAAKPGHSGENIELGTVQVGTMTIRAARDKGEIKPGGDAPIDVWIDGGLGNGVSAVRFWIGVEDAKGSVKAKADVEDGKWHAHAEVPNPMPVDAKFWVEIETAKGEKSVGSIALSKAAETSAAGTKQKMVVGCATCLLKMSAVTGCKLGISVGGKPYLVKGVDIDSLGDAHAADGLCNVFRDAWVVGKLEGDAFAATSIELIPR